MAQESGMGGAVSGGFGRGKLIFYDTMSEETPAKTDEKPKKPRIVVVGSMNVDHTQKYRNPAKR